MPDTVISVENLGKKYTIGHQRNGSDGLRHALNDFVTAPFRALRRETGDGGRKTGDGRPKTVVGPRSSVSRPRSSVPGRRSPVSGLPSSVAIASGQEK